MHYFFQCACLGKYLVDPEVFKEKLAHNPEALETFCARVNAGDIIESVLNLGDHCPECAPNQPYSFKIEVQSVLDAKEC